MNKAAADAFAGQVMDELPEEISEALEGVTVYVVEGRTDPELKIAIKNAGMERADVMPDFRGLFLGTPAMAFSDDAAELAEGSIVLNALALDSLEDVRDTLAHEIGHALGMSEEEVENLGLG